MAALSQEAPLYPSGGNLQRFREDSRHALMALGIAEDHHKLYHEDGILARVKTAWRELRQLEITGSPARGGDSTMPQGYLLGTGRHSHEQIRTQWTRFADCVHDARVLYYKERLRGVQEELVCARGMIYVNLATHILAAVYKEALVRRTVTDTYVIESVTNPTLDPASASRLKDALDYSQRLALRALNVRAATHAVVGCGNLPLLSDVGQPAQATLLDMANLAVRQAEAGEPLRHVVALTGPGKAGVCMDMPKYVCPEDCTLPFGLAGVLALCVAGLNDKHACVTDATRGKVVQLARFVVGYDPKKAEETDARVTHLMTLLSKAAGVSNAMATTMHHTVVEGMRSQELAQAREQLETRLRETAAAASSARSVLGARPTTSVALSEVGSRVTSFGSSASATSSLAAMPIPPGMPPAPTGGGAAATGTAMVRATEDRQPPVRAGSPPRERQAHSQPNTPGGKRNRAGQPRQDDRQPGRSNSGQGGSYRHMGASGTDGAGGGRSITGGGGAGSGHGGGGGHGVPRHARGPRPQGGRGRGTGVRARSAPGGSAALRHGSPQRR
jgi:hypothetical protein